MGGQTHSMDIETWTFRSLNGSIRIDNVSVPGTSHTHLLEHGLIPEPYERFNERALAWVTHTTWVYEAVVSLPSGLPGRAPVLLFESLDGVAHVHWNGSPLGGGRPAVNAFRPHTFTLADDAVRRGDNNLTVIFQPPLAYAREKV
ncbi:hypothetical protein P43SY_002532 [Pythium insidiosum]|uniref:Beta-mannosidase-like galactose-binding domain-containing protein n=1 Tax=Pythium insidiosum TaxID=114742 RepID=A0AAD5QFG5_PYTIN|nr:hypothetical protein P43SY_002532 [Pythium insidiosum]KAJ0412662.1 hypothetical protein ATCC90586_002292 [Pythium insidiosum]